MVNWPAATAHRRRCCCTEAAAPPLLLLMMIRQISKPIHQLSLAADAKLVTHALSRFRRLAPQLLLLLLFLTVHR
jgi:hypothetical protein